MPPNHPPSDRLLKLLVLKRHEQPPPGYFDRFSSGVLARLEPPVPAQQPSILQRFFEGILDRSVVVGAYGCLVVAIVVTGLNVAGYYDVEAHRSVEGATPMATAIIPEPTLPGSTTPGSGWLAQADRKPSFNPIIPSRAPSFLFNPNGFQGSAQHPLAREASYTVQP